MANDITVVIAAHNASAYIEETLESILMQTLIPAEIVVVDDASTDDTASRVMRFGGRVRLICREKNKGNPGVPRNDGIRTARTEYIQVFDADDIMHPDMLQRISDALAAKPDLQVVFSDMRKFAAPGVAFTPHSTANYRFRALMRPCGRNIFVLEQPRIFEALMYEYSLGCGALFFSKKAWSQAGEYGSNVGSSEDLDLSFRLARTHAFGFVDEVLFDYRIHAGGLSARKLEHYRSNIDSIWRYIDLPAPAKARRAATRRIAEMEIDLTWAHADNGDTRGALKCWLNALAAAGPSARLAGHTSKLARHAVALGCNRLLRRRALKAG